MMSLDLLAIWLPKQVETDLELRILQGDHLVAKGVLEVGLQKPYVNLGSPRYVAQSNPVILSSFWMAFDMTQNGSKWIILRIFLGHSWWWWTQVEILRQKVSCQIIPQTWISGWGKGESKHLIFFPGFCTIQTVVGLGISEPSTGRYLKWFLMLQPWRSASWRFHWYLRARCLAQRYRMGCLGVKQLKLMATSSEFYFKGQQKGLEDSCEV